MFWVESIVKSPAHEIVPRNEREKLHTVTYPRRHFSENHAKGHTKQTVPPKQFSSAEREHWAYHINCSNFIQRPFVKNDIRPSLLPHHSSTERRIRTNSTRFIDEAHGTTPRRSHPYIVRIGFRPTKVSMNFNGSSSERQSCSRHQTFYIECPA